MMRTGIDRREICMHGEFHPRKIPLDLVQCPGKMRFMTMSGAHLDKIETEV